MRHMKRKCAPLPLNKTFLREWRKERGLTIEQLAERSGLSIATISDIETGRVAYTQHSLERLAKALNVAIGLILSCNPTNEHDPWRIVEKFSQLDETRRIQLADLVKVLSR